MTAVVTIAAFAIVVHVVTGLAAAGHALLTKRDPRAAIAWVGFIAMVPLVGPLAYVLLGINRVHRRARELRHEDVSRITATVTAPELARLSSTTLRSIARATSIVCSYELKSGNRLELFEGGAAYEAMVHAIGGATTSVGLATYIFDTGASGRRFVDALAGAVRRGVEVRVLVDAVGERYSWPSARHLLVRAGVPTATFL